VIVIGAKGLAKEVLGVLIQHSLANIYFFDNLSSDAPDKLYGKFPVLTSVDDAVRIFKETNDPSFTLGLGSPAHRLKLTKLLEEAGGVLTSAISKHAHIGSFGNSIEAGCTILDGAVITNGVTIGRGCLINPHVSISHDAHVGDFVEISPGVRLTGACEVGDFSVIGTNAVILPKVKIGQNVIIGAGAVVTKDVPDNSLVVGVPAQIKKVLPPFNG
jgi:sugar O-acyltransferase (sialic acid O-acetyltransferase NeuD family)